MNASVHDGLNEGSQVFVFHGTLHLNETPPITAILHCLILQITLASLIANWTIQRVVDLHRSHCCLDIHSCRSHHVCNVMNMFLRLSDVFNTPSTKAPHRHSDQNFTSKNSMTPSRAFLTNGVSVLMSMPGPAGIAHDATGFGLLVTCTQTHYGSTVQATRTILGSCITYLLHATLCTLPTKTQKESSSTLAQINGIPPPSTFCNCQL